MFQNIFNKLLLRNINISSPLHQRIYYNKVHFKNSTIPKEATTTIAPLNIVWQQIGKTKTQNYSNLNKISILVQSLENKQQIGAIKYLMATLYQSQVAESELINNQSLKQLLKQHSFIKLEMMLYIITSKHRNNVLNKQPIEEATKNREISEAINNLYLQCFKQILPNSEGIQKLQVQALLFKNFGKHLIQNQIQQKGLLYLRKSIESHSKLVVEEYKKLEQFNKVRENYKGKQKIKIDKDKQDLQGNAMKQNIRRLVQSMFQTLYLYYNEKKIQIKTSNITVDKKAQGALLDIVSIINESMKLKSIVPGIKNYSRYYHRLTLIGLQFEYFYYLSKKKDEISDIIIKMKQFYVDCHRDLEDMTDYLQIQKEISLAMMSVKLHLSRIEKKNIREQLMLTSQEIIQIGKFERKNYKNVMLKLLGEFIKVNCP